MSSSNFQVFLFALPSLALVLSQVVENLLSSYEKIRSIRSKYSGLIDDDGVPEDIVGELKGYAAGRMDVDIQALTEQLIEQWGGNLRPDDRPNEIRLEIHRSLTAAARRIDEGYSIEIREYRLPEADEGEEEQAEGALPEGATSETEQARQAIAERQPRMKAMNMTGTPILELPSADDREPDGAPDAERPE